MNITDLFTVFHVTVYLCIIVCIVAVVDTIITIVRHFRKKHDNPKELDTTNWRWRD